ncbi:carbohydrate ABC transporter substrate-binding protein [Xylanibacillus composti]|uniref:Extracellular solute-binding protein n=1 Tax=Xylanibacillus composti TaxID=1572762 RepID=A0A8J4H0H9_9BACL|nr:ABC transporter substrate-binding protein [Xylanibacillus composti]MDT9725127.1 carbohydrate ABC transporter substrate-binding protein [Xylanibacillus composti]GIQ67300.1 hypothetical protein XYCOK13_01240 [Xylanibacillus composti]
MRRAKHVLITLLLSALYLAGCSSNGIEKDDITLRIWVEEVSQTHTQAFGELKAQYPNADVEFIHIRELVEQPVQIYENLEELYLDLNPDVVISNPVTFPLLASQGYLLNLESNMRQDGIVVEDMHPPVMEWIRDQGNGQVYGLTPYFDTEVLFYNKKLFDEFNISYPTGRMTWGGILDLIMRLPASNQGERLYGFYVGFEGDPASLLDRISRTNGLSYLDWENKKVTYEDPRWPEIYSLVSRVEQSGLLLQHSTIQEEGQQPADLFKQNKLAVMFGDYGTFEKLSYESDLAFGAVTQPVAEDDRSAGFLNLEEIYSVNANSTNKDAAWTFVRAVMNQSEPGKLPVAINAVAQHDERAAVFYELDYKREHAINFWEVPLAFSAEMNTLRRESLARILEGDPINEVLKQLESDGQAMLGSLSGIE